MGNWFSSLFEDKKEAPKAEPAVDVPPTSATAVPSPDTGAPTADATPSPVVAAPAVASPPAAAPIAAAPVPTAAAEQKIDKKSLMCFTKKNGTCVVRNSIESGLFDFMAIDALLAEVIYRAPGSIRGNEFLIDGCVGTCSSMRRSFFVMAPISVWYFSFRLRFLHLRPHGANFGRRLR